MFDARSILDILVGGGQRRSSRPFDSTTFKDMLDQLGDQDTPPAANRPPISGSGPQQAPGGNWTEQRYPQDTTARPGAPAGGPGGGMGIEDLLRSILTQMQQGQPQQGQPPSGTPPAGQPAGTPEVSQDLQDLLRGILQGGQPGGVRIPVNRVVGEGGASEPAGGGGLADVLKQLLGQATTGAREGAARIDEATGFSGKAREALGQATGQSPDELIAKVKQLITENQLTAGAALGGLGALVLGTSGGRSLAGTAIKLGGLALIGGLAYKAFQNYQQGKPPISAGGDARDKAQTLIPAPEGSGFEAGVVTHDAARRYIRAMIAAAAADGRIDADEQQRILGGLRQAGLDDAAHKFLAAEITSPATVAELASGVASPEEAVQVYTAARIAVADDNAEEHAFLSALAEALGIDGDLVAQVDAAARAAAA